MGIPNDFKASYLAKQNKTTETVYSKSPATKRKNQTQLESDQTRHAPNLRSSSKSNQDHQVESDIDNAEKKKKPLLNIKKTNKKNTSEITQMLQSSCISNKPSNASKNAKSNIRQSSLLF